LIGAAIGYGVIRAVSDGYYYATGREGLGYGDGKLLAIVGALVGWRGVLFGLFAGSVLGTIFGVAALALRKQAPEEDEAEATIDGKTAEATVDAKADEAAVDAVEPKAAADGEAAAVDGDDADETDDSPSIRHLELPFGPYLAAAAMFYVLAEPWLRVNLWFLRG
jgi:leader peptidase (prepilin peptidase)/N-methyltransferase